MSPTVEVRSLSAEPVGGDAGLRPAFVCNRILDFDGVSSDHGISAVEHVRKERVTQ